MDLNKKKCLPCEGLTDPLTDAEEDKYMANVGKWKILRDGIHKIERKYTLLHFLEAIEFVNKIAELSENEGHHPNISISYNLVAIEVYTHAINGLSENDFILAVKIDEIYNEKYSVT